MDEVMEYYGKAGDTKGTGPGYAFGGYWIHFWGFGCTEIGNSNALDAVVRVLDADSSIVARWLILAYIWKHTPVRYHGAIMHLVCWGTNQKLGAVRHGNRKAPPPDTQQYETQQYPGSVRPTKRVMYVIQDIDLLNPEDKTPDPADP